jgi:UDPglucose--hexose-1-phosphate uridylyltransferase
MILPKTHVNAISDLSQDQIISLAESLSVLTIKYDNLFSCSFPYSMGIHQTPSDRVAEFHLHLHFYPPLLRSASIKKFLVGYEMLAEPQRDLTPEQAAASIRSLSSTHYTKC